MKKENLQTQGRKTQNTKENKKFYQEQKIPSVSSWILLQLKRKTLQNYQSQPSEKKVIKYITSKTTEPPGNLVVTN